MATCIISASSFCACPPAFVPQSKGGRSKYNTRPLAAIDGLTCPPRPPPSSLAAVSAQAVQTDDTSTTITVSRSDFPSDFLFGVATSAFQVEGAPYAGGRGTTIWDTFVHLPGRITDNDLNYPGPRFYELFEKDLEMVKDLGFNAFRLSISWTRILPNTSQVPSSEGIEFYNKVINAIVRNGLTPIVTLFHWETPQYLENDPEVLGWRTKNIVPYFVKLADICFRHFGDRVKYWLTINELWTCTVFGYGFGTMAPGRCTNSLVDNPYCPAGDSRVEPYLVGHHLHIAHAKVYRHYKKYYKDLQGGMCGTNPVIFGGEPYSNSKDDAIALERYLQFRNGWQIDPLFFGDYPSTMKEILGDRLPSFTEEESNELKNSFDIFGLNYYTSSYVKNAAIETTTWGRNSDGGYATSATNEDGKIIGTLMGPTDNTVAATSWIYNCPTQLIGLLQWMTNRYGGFSCFISENGIMDINPLDKEQCLEDTQRITFIQGHLAALNTALKWGKENNSLDVKGYCYWSFIDNFEWSSGYSYRFGTVYVDFDNGDEPTRILKSSAKWFKEFLTA